MDATVQTLLESGVAPSTASAYRSGVRRYKSFCTETGLSAFPLTETVVCRFVAHLHQAQLSLSSIRLYLSAIRFSQIAYGNGNPHLETFDRLHYVVRGVARTQPRSGRTSRLPITVEILQHLLRAWSSHSSHYEAVMLWAACTLGFFAFLRAGEFIAGESNSHSVLTPADVRVDSRENASFLAITLRGSKTDPYGIGHVLYVGRTGSPYLPSGCNAVFSGNQATRGWPPIHTCGLFTFDKSAAHRGSEVSSGELGGGHSSLFGA